MKDSFHPTFRKLRWKLCGFYYIVPIFLLGIAVIVWGAVALETEKSEVVDLAEARKQGIRPSSYDTIYLDITSISEQFRHREHNRHRSDANDYLIEDINGNKYILRVFCSGQKLLEQAQRQLEQNKNPENSVRITAYVGMYENSDIEPIIDAFHLNMSAEDFRIIYGDYLINFDGTGKPLKDVFPYEILFIGIVISGIACVLLVRRSRNFSASIKEIKTPVSEKILLSELKNADAIFKKYNLYLGAGFLFLKPQGVIVPYDEIETIHCYDKVIMKIPMAAYNYLITMHTNSGREIVFGSISSEIKPERYFKMAMIVKAEIQKHIEPPKTIG